MQEIDIENYPVPEGFLLIKADSFVGKVYDDYIEWCEKKDKQPKTQEIDIEKIRGLLKKGLNGLGAHIRGHTKFSADAMKDIQEALFLLSKPCETCPACQAPARRADALSQQAGEIEQLEDENKRLKALCWRESQVLKEALKRKNNKSMIAVVVSSLEDQAL